MGSYTGQLAGCYSAPNYSALYLLLLCFYPAFSFLLLYVDSVLTLLLLYFYSALTLLMLCCNSAREVSTAQPQLVH